MAAPLAAVPVEVRQKAAHEWAIKFVHNDVGEVMVKKTGLKAALAVFCTNHVLYRHAAEHEPQALRQAHYALTPGYSIEEIIDEMQRKGK